MLINEELGEFRCLKYFFVVNDIFIGFGQKIYVLVEYIFLGGEDIIKFLVSQGIDQGIVQLKIDKEFVDLFQKSIYRKYLYF